MGRLRINITFLLLLFVLPASAEARTVLLEPDGTTAPRVQHWIDTARVPTPDLTYRLVWGPCPSGAFERACVAPGPSANPALNRVMYLEPRVNRYAVLHEVGHIADANQFHITGTSFFEPPTPDANPWAHQRFLRIAQLTGPDTNPREAWAVAYGFCAEFGNRIPPERLFWRAAGYLPRPAARHRRMCRFIRNLYRWHYRPPDPAS